MLYNEFLSFWFVTSVDGTERNETFLNYHDDSWELYDQSDPDVVFHKEEMQEHGNLAGEDAELERIKGRVAELVRSASQPEQNKGS